VVQGAFGALCDEVMAVWGPPPNREAGGLTVQAGAPATAGPTSTM
jgi:hypothetical protein